MDGKSLDIQQTQFEKLKELFPEAISEGKIDWEKLKATLGEDITFSNERYVLNWAGKSDAFKVLQSPTTATLSPAKEESVNFDDTGHLFIEGENLEVLKVLQKSYYGKVKMIYIDPPYNTGNDHFIYPDRFSESKNDYLKRVGEKDEEGYMTREGMYRKNSRDSGHYHSNWLSMMYPRLFLARNLLKDDGVIFVSIDDNEVHNLRLMMNEIFGEENFIECLTWNKRVPKNDKGIGSIHEYVLIFTKNSQFEHKFTMAKEGIPEINSLLEKLKSKNTPIPEAESEIRKLYNKKGYDRGITLYNSLDSSYRLYGKINMSWPNANTFGSKYEVLHPKTKKPVRVPDRGWRWKEETFLEAVDYDNVKELHDGTFLCGRIWFDKDEKTQPSSVLYLDDVDTLLLRSILSLKSDGGIEVENLFQGKSYFSYPKPTSLIKTLVRSIELKNNDIVLDFFSGSATTAHTILDLNKEDNTDRKFICVQLPEETDEKSEAYKAGYQTIADIAKERIRRVIKKIESEQEREKKEKAEKLDFGDKKEATKLDLGFKVFKLQPSNFKIWRGNKFENGEQLEKQLDAFTDPTKEGSVEESMLYELLLKSGFDLNSTVENKGNYFVVNNGEMVVALSNISEAIVNEIISLKPQKCIALDKLFAGNDQLKTNTVLQMRDAGVEFKTI
jgi:adenine-specific DNA-methyltransferase